MKFHGLTIVSLCLGIVLLLVGLPLSLRKVPRNGLYGYRTDKTLSSDEIWYSANAFTGKALGCAGVVTLVLTIALCVWQRNHAGTPTLALTYGSCAEIIPAFIAIIVSVIYVAKL